MPVSWTIAEQDQFISEVVERAQPGLRNFIRKHVADTSEAEDILQDVFYELIAAYRLMKPIEHVTAWLFRVAQNRIVDLFRRKKPGSLNNPSLRRRGL
jgi:RNA polymerase sigma factor (sigma-70 family)